MGPCTTGAQQFFVKTLSEVRELVKHNGTENLSGMYRIIYDTTSKKAEVTELELVPDFALEVKDWEKAVSIGAKPGKIDPLDGLMYWE